jgi:hypothetical protein
VKYIPNSLNCGYERGLYQVTSATKQCWCAPFLNKAIAIYSSSVLLSSTLPEPSELLFAEPTAFSDRNRYKSPCWGFRECSVWPQHRSSTVTFTHWQTWKCTVTKLIRERDVFLTHSSSNVFVKICIYPWLLWRFVKKYWRQDCDILCGERSYMFL